MVLRLGWPLSRADGRAKRLRRVFSAAWRDPYYSSVLCGCDFSRKDFRSLSSEDALRRFPFSRLADLERHGIVMERRYQPAIAFPLKPSIPAVRPCRGSGRYSALAAPAADLRCTAYRRQEIRPRVEYAVLALFGPGEAMLSDDDRDLFWDAFGVPAYDVLVGFDGTVLAFECEAHRGLHATRDVVFESFEGLAWFTSLTDTTRPSIRLETGLSGQFAQASCECGRPGPWLSRFRETPGLRNNAVSSSAAD
jgi:hypothetical protein